MTCRYAVMCSEESNQSVIIDMWAKRLGHMRKRVFDWSELVKSCGDYQLKMITLTYDYFGTLGTKYEWQPNDIRDFMLNLRNVLGSNLLAYAWVGELQNNGHPHYHVLIAVRRGAIIPYPDKSGLWVKGMSKIQSNIRTVFYICTYVKKEYQKEFEKYPKNMRLFAVWISGRLFPDKLLRLRFMNLSNLGKRIVSNFGWSELRFMGEYKERWRFIGVAEGLEYAKLLAWGV